MENRGFEFRQFKRFFILQTVQARFWTHPNQGYTGFFFPEGKTAERKADRSSAFCQFMNKRSYTSSPPTYRRG